MEPKNIVIVSLIALLANGVMHMIPTSAGEPINGAKSFDLSEEQEKQLIASANGGDNEAAVRLARYYAFV